MILFFSGVAVGFVACAVLLYWALSQPINFFK